VAKHIHLIGICGTAMASLAGMLQARGHRITGSDAAAYPPMSDVLAGLGIPLLQPYAEANLTPRPDLVIVGNAISRGNVELEYVLDTRIPFTSMAAVLHDEFLRGANRWWWRGRMARRRRPACWRGFMRSRRARGRSCAVVPDWGRGGELWHQLYGAPRDRGVAQPFILEGDEYDTAFFDKGPKFLHYFPGRRDPDACGVRPRGHLSRPCGGEDGVQAAGESDSAARARGRVRWQRECERVRGEGVLRGRAVWVRAGLALARSADAARGRRRPPLDAAARGRAVCGVAAADGGRTQRAECDGCGGAGGGPGSSGGGDCGGAGDVPVGEAAAGGAGRGEWRDDHRRLCASSDGDSRDAAGAADGLCGAADSGRFWSRGRIRCGGMCSRRRWWRAWRWRIAACWLGVQVGGDSCGRAAASGERGCGIARAGTSSRICMRMRMRLWRQLRRSCVRAMWWRFCRMVDSAGFTTSYQRR
jgi:hypothetical protein